MATRVKMDQARKARSLYSAIFALRPGSEERKELRSAGVSESRIDSLYPLTMEDILEVLRVQVEANGLHRWASPNFQWSSEFVYWARRAEMSSELWDEFCEGRSALSWWKVVPTGVRTAVFEVLESRRYNTRYQLTAQMAFSFWEACWLEANVEQMADPMRIHARFLGVAQRLVPELEKAHR